MRGLVIALSLLAATSAGAAVRVEHHSRVTRPYKVVPAKKDTIDFSKPFWFVTFYREQIQPGVDLLLW